MAAVLKQLTDRGHVPEALRLAHLITSAVVKGRKWASGLEVIANTDILETIKNAIARCPPG